MSPEIGKVLSNGLFFRNYLDAASFPGGSAHAAPVCEEVHSEREILLVVQGSCSFSYSGHTLELHKGDVLFIDSWESHQYGYALEENNGLHIWVHLHSQHVLASVVELGSISPMTQPLMCLPDDLLPALNRRWDAAIRERRKDPRASEHYRSMVRLLQEEILWNVFTPGFAEDQDSLEKQLENFLSVNYGHRVTLTELANHFGRNRAYLARLFKKTHGMTVGEFINRTREHYTEAALMRGMTQKEIASQLGFHSAMAFWLWRKRRSMKQKEAKTNA